MRPSMSTCQASRSGLGLANRSGLGHGLFAARLFLASGLGFAGLANAPDDADHFSAAGGVAVGHAGNVEDESRDAGFDMLPDLIAERQQRRVKDHPSR